MTFDPIAASKLRRALHKECANANLNGLREVLHELYESEASPMGDHSDVGKPATFAPLVEICCLAHSHALAYAYPPIRVHIANEMYANVDSLSAGFKIDRNTMSRIRKAIEACKTTCNIDDAQSSVEKILLGTQLEGRVKVARHSVSYPPKTMNLLSAQ